MKGDLTTLQLARRIATAVLAAGPTRQRDSTNDRPTQAVLRVMRQTSTWFSRVVETELEAENWMLDKERRLR